MISEVSGPKTPLQPPPPPAEAGTYLAPGFRFHPTDEELISYYLKRKITGRPIKADAISEIDLYRAEPWDLPPRSRLRSRDLEWYFFTSLDRKYSNRCRTNRATAEGYWKTTGKDRPIQSRSRTIGMKKTLVYHAGRAPRGQRTNWVMHEYRLDDEELARSGISQDCYVVCRIFQKNGSGPQNGAQYGAPFIEEEWEREEEGDIKLVPVDADRYALMDPAGQDFVQLGDFLQDPDSSIRHLDSFPFEATTSDNQTEGSSNFLEGILKDQDSLDDVPQEADFSASRDNTSFNMLVENNVLEDQLNYASMHKGYVQLKDMFSGDDMNCSPKTYASHFLLEGDSPNNNGDANQLDQLQMCPAVQNEMFPQSFDLSGDVAWEYSSGQLAEDNLVYYDALSNEIPYSDGFACETSLTPLAEFDLLEDLISFYDTSKDSLSNASPIQFLSQSNKLNSSEWMQSNSSPEVVGSSTLSSKEVFNVPDGLGKMPSLGKTSSGDGSTGCNDSMTKDVKPEVYEDKTLTKRLASMLHSISAPPAFADESGLKGKTAAQIPAASGSALRLTAGMIQIDNWTSMRYTGSWTLQKRAELGFFSYGMDASMVCKLASHNPRNKVLSGIYSAFCRNSFTLFVLSAVMLAFSYKIGTYVCQL